MSRGFTLLELLAVAAITAILLAIAVPSYQRYAQRTHRADAIRSILSIAACLERSRIGTGYYNTLACSDAASSDYYLLRIAPADQTSALSFRISAEPRTDSSGDLCGSLSMDQAGSRGISGPEDRLAACWGGR